MADKFLNMPAGDMDAMPGEDMVMLDTGIAGPMTGKEMPGLNMEEMDGQYCESFTAFAAGGMDVMPGEQMNVPAAGDMSSMHGERMVRNDAKQTIEIPGTWQLLLLQTSK